MVARPAPNPWVERADQLTLRGLWLLSNEGGQGRVLATLAALAWPDPGLETQAELPGAVEADRVLPHLEAEEVEPHPSVDGLQGVTDPGLLGLSSKPSSASHCA